MKLLACLLLAAGAAAQQPQRIYIAPDDHTDYMWTADEETYRQVYLEMIDYYLDQMDRTAKDHPDHHARWNCDGNLWMWTYERNRTPEQFERFLNRIRDGHMSVPLNAAASCFGATPAEAVLRGMYYAGRIERRHNVRFPLAVAMENQTLPYGLGALWAGAGARYSWRGICGCASRLLPVRHTLRQHEIYWWQGQDASRILMKWNSLLREEGKEKKQLSSNKCIGGYAEAFDPLASLDFIDSNERFKQVWPFNVTGIFGKGWDRLKTMDDEVVRAAKQRSRPGRRVIVSNEEDFFRDFEKTYGRELPVFSAAFGNEWDLYVASVPELAARAKRVTEKLRTAEALATLVSLKRPPFLRGREAARDLAFMNLGLFWEHNWTADGPIRRETRAAWGSRILSEVEQYVDSLEADAARALATMIPKPGEHPRFYIFNPLSWTRTDTADFPYEGSEEITVVDVASGQAVPFEFVQLDWRRFLKGRRHLRVLARDLPPVGYRVYEIQPRKGAAQEPAVTGREGAFENARYRLKVNARGSIVSLIEKAGNRELAVRLNDLGDALGELSLESSGAVSATIKAQIRAPLARTTRITIYRDIPRIDISNEITENFAGVLAWDFHFNLQSPDVWHEETGAIIRARLTAEGGHYSPVHSRLDWLSMGHFAAISGDGGAGISISSPDLSFMRLGASEVAGGVSRLDTATPLISVLAGGQVDGPRLGIPSQGGEKHFLQRFSLQPFTRFNPADSMRFALEHQNPLRASAVTGGTGYPESVYSFLSLKNPDTLLWALKPAEEGVERGVIARVWNVSPEPRRISLSLADTVVRAEKTTHIETGLGAAHVEKGALEADAASSQMLTFRLHTRQSQRAGALRNDVPPRRRAVK
ncbi:MAG: glycoside hydrolase [Chloroflexi bacterium]|nr:glycoside hydrolase [Chloroflexota bacterium]